MSTGEVYVIVHNVRSLHNVGSVFRTADGAGVAKIFLTGYTPAPLDEMGRPRREIQKTALGAEHTVPWERAKNISRLIEKLQKEGVSVIVLEYTKKALDYRRYVRKGSVALIIGNEVRGVSKKIIEKCDTVLQIPMRGTKESLNVSVAFGIAVYALTDTRGTR